MGYTKRNLPSTILKGILTNCDKLKNSINRLSVNNRFIGLSGSIKNVDLISDAELELTCRRANDKIDFVVKIEAVVNKYGKAVLNVNKK